MRLGIVDWGIGGISLHKLIQETLGDLPTTYFSDTGVTPYGRMSRFELASRLEAVLRFLEDRGVTHVLIGCNAASTAIGDLHSRSLQIGGVIEPAVNMAVAHSPACLGLIGGRRTVASGVYRRAFAERGIPVHQRVAQPLSAFIEAGDTTSDTLRSEARRILKPLGRCSHILLACTHYPAVTDPLRSAVPHTTEFLDPASAVVDRVAKWRIARGTDSEFMTSGDPEAMKRAAANAFGVELPGASRVTV